FRAGRRSVAHYIFFTTRFPLWRWPLVPSHGRSDDRQPGFWRFEKRRGGTMKRAGRQATIVAMALAWWSVAPAAQEQEAAVPQEQAAPAQQEPAPAAPQPESVTAPQAPATTAQEQPAAAPQEQPAATPQEQPAVAPVEQPATAPAQEEAPAPTRRVVAEEPAVEEEPPAEIIEEPQYTRFVAINDAAPGRLFDAGATAPDPGDPNRLVIAFHSGVDPATFRVTDFRASTAAFNHLSAMDTISFKIEAPKGQRISKVIYTQRGTGSQIRLGRAAGATHWVVGEYAAQLGVFTTNPSVVGTADFSAQPQAMVDVSITTGLFAFAAPTSGSASIEVTSAEVQVELVPAID